MDKQGFSDGAERYLQRINKEGCQECGEDCDEFQCSSSRS